MSAEVTIGRQAGASTRMVPQRSATTAAPSSSMRLGPAPSEKGNDALGVCHVLGLLGRGSEYLERLTRNQVRRRLSERATDALEGGKLLLSGQVR